jgi:hypothetical protein
LGQTDIIGHGATIDRGGLMTFRDMLRKIKERILLIEQQLSVFESSQPSVECFARRRRDDVIGAHISPAWRWLEWTCRGAAQTVFSNRD